MHVATINNEEIRKLVDQTLLHDADATTKLVAYVQAILERLDGHIFHGLTDPKDVIQETTIRVWQRLDSFVGVSVGEFRHWVSKVARNVQTDLFRFERRDCRDNRRIDQSSKDVLDDIFVSRDAGPSENASSSEIAAILRESLSELNVERQQLVRLRFYNSCNWLEISQRMGKSVATCRRTYYRALDQCKQAVAEKLSLDELNSKEERYASTG